MGCYDQMCAQLGPTSAGTQKLLQMHQSVKRAAEAFGSLDPQKLAEARGTPALRARLGEAVLSYTTRRVHARPELTVLSPFAQEVSHGRSHALRRR